MSKYFKIATDKIVSLDYISIFGRLYGKTIDDIRMLPNKKTMMVVVNGKGMLIKIKGGKLQLFPLIKVGGTEVEFGTQIN